MKRIKIGIVGAGGIAQFAYIGRLQKLPEADLTAICDTNRKKAAEVARRYGIARFYSDHKKMLERENLDAVVICTPNFLHKDQTIDALHAGCHVLCEKPLALNYREGEEMVKVAREENKRLMVALCWRFRADSQFLKKLIQRGELGNIYYAKAAYLRRRGIPGLGGWFTTKSLSGGGVMIDCGVHILDLALWLMGFPRPVGVYGATYAIFGERAGEGDWPPPETRICEVKPQAKTSDVEDFATAFIRFDNGATLFIETCWAANLQSQYYLSLLGDKGGAELLPRFRIYQEKGGTQVDITPQIEEGDSYEQEIKHFLKCIKEDKVPEPSGEKALVVTRIINALYESARTGREVRW